MGLRDGSYAKVWSAKQKGKVYSAQISVSRKNKDGGGYITDYSDYVNFAGEAAKKVAEMGLPEQFDPNNRSGRNIQIKGSPDITSWYNSELADKLLSTIEDSNLTGDSKQGLSRFVRNSAKVKTITIWDFEVQDDNGGQRAKNSSKSATTSKSSASAARADAYDDDEDLPF